MEYRGGRNRRGRGRHSPQILHYVPRQPKSSFFNGFCSFLVMTSLVVVTYYILDYHSQICSSKCSGMGNITRDISEIAKNLSLMKSSYYDLEMKIIKISHDLPKIEGQLDVLEALGKTMDRGDNTNGFLKKSGEILNKSLSDGIPLHNLTMEID